MNGLEYKEKIAINVTKSVRKQSIFHNIKYKQGGRQRMIQNQAAMRADVNAFSNDILLNALEGIKKRLAMEELEKLSQGELDFFLSLACEVIAEIQYRIANGRINLPDVIP